MIDVINLCGKETSVAPFGNIAFNPSMDKLLHPLYSLGWNNLSIPQLQRYNRPSLGTD